MTFIARKATYRLGRASYAIFAKDFDGGASGLTTAMKGAALSAGDTKRLRQELAELKEMVRLGAGVLGDMQRIGVIENLLGRRQDIADRCAARSADSHLPLGLSLSTPTERSRSK